MRMWCSDDGPGQALDAYTAIAKGTTVLPATVSGAGAGAGGPGKKKRRKPKAVTTAPGAQ